MTWIMEPLQRPQGWQGRCSHKGIVRDVRDLNGRLWKMQHGTKRPLTALNFRCFHACMLYKQKEWTGCKCTSMPFSVICTHAHELVLQKNKIGLNISWITFSGSHWLTILTFISFTEVLISGFSNVQYFGKKNIDVSALWATFFVINIKNCVSYGGTVV